MSLIDWSDPEEMVGLLLEYVRDEALEERDRDRVNFLRGLRRDLETLSVSVDRPAEIAHAIEEVRAAQPSEFLGDSVIAHVDACVEELRRIESATTEVRSRTP